MNTTTNIIVIGQLSIRIINGRNGPFRVGTLQTGIGKFAVKDPILDQYDEGKYDGEFEITSIYQGNYIAGDRSVTEIRANLGNISINDVDDKKPESVDLEPDPIDTDVSEVVEKSKPTQKKDEPSAEKNDDESLFGNLMPLSSRVKLDATVDRKTLRQQSDRLGQLGYKFNPKGQTWHNPPID